jgi:hypothetical protein
VIVLVSGLTLERWQEECRLVEERFSLFRPFAESPFFGFRGIVSRSGCTYRVTVAAEMDMYPRYVPWVFVTPPIAGATADVKLCLDVGWHRDSTFADVIGAVVLHIERSFQNEEKSVRSSCAGLPHSSSG